MRYINTIDDTIQFIDVDNTITNVPVNGVYTFIKGDTISFILLRRLDNEGYCVMTTRASDVEINGTVYSIDDYIDGTATQDLYTATGLRFEVVEELPDEGQNGVIYLVPNEDDTYDEYIWLEDEERFERVGNTDVDLSDYYTKEEVDLMLADYAETSDLDALESEVEENGRVTAAALVDLDNRKADTEDLADVAFSGSYNDLENTPTIPIVPTNVSAFTNDADYATETYVDNAIAQIPQPDMSNYALVVDVEEMGEGTAAALVNLNHEIDILKSQIQTVNSRIDHYHTYRYVVQLSDVNTPGSFITLDDDIVTENVAQGTTYRVDVTRFLGDEYVGEDLVCGDFFLMLESEGAGITLNNCQFTTSNVDEQYYTLTFADDHNELTYDFTLAIS